MIRTLHFLITRRELKEYSISKLRGNKDRKDFKVKIGDIDYGFAVMNGLTGIHALLNELASGRNDIHFVEVMACRGGCIAGGGQPIHKAQNDQKARSKTLYELDERAAIRAAHKNPKVNDIYANFLGEPMSEKCKSHLHTGFSKKEVLL